MSVQNVSAIKPVLVQAPKKEEVEGKITQAQKEIKDGKKKLALALAGLATIGVVGAGILYKLKTDKKISSKVVQNVKESVQNMPDLAKNTAEEFDKTWKVTRYKNGIGKYSSTVAEEGGKYKNTDITFVEPNSSDMRSMIKVIDEEFEKNISVSRYTPKGGVQTTSDILMKKDANGNVIEVINNKYNGSHFNGGKQITTKIQRDDAGKVISSERTICEIEPTAKPNKSSK